MTPLQFVDKWRPVALTERAAAHSHFNDLCDLLDHPKPLDVDKTGEEFTFEKGVKKSGGGDGFADVWKKSHFAWEYKKRKRNLDDALGQLARYALALENPPLHIACDTESFRIVTAWTNTLPRSYDISLEDILEPARLDNLRWAFFDPDRLRPGGTRADLTEQAADRFCSIADNLRARGYQSPQIAHFVNQLAFLFFAEDVKLLPNGYFRRVLREISERPKDSKALMDALFAILAKGGRFGLDRLPHVNGGLFDGQEALTLHEDDVPLLVAAGSQSWAHIDPSIFGTLFERFLDPDKRSQIGAHYTDAVKINQIIDPVIVRPLTTAWLLTKAKIEALTSKARTKGVRAKEWQEAERHRSAFLDKLRNIRILDPACGSGNFLYTALKAVKDLEHKANQECEVFGLPPRMPLVGPEILQGIELNPLAAELARTAVWIGDIQWSIQNGIYSRPEPILREINSIECRDALIDESGALASWPICDYIVGNPPFLGDKKMLSSFGRDYTDRLRNCFSGDVEGRADLVCYWFYKATEALKSKQAVSAGLIATNSIRQTSNRKVLANIKTDLRIFEAWQDEEWTVEGAAVRVSIVCFDGGTQSDEIRLDGKIVAGINADLTSYSNIRANLSDVNKLPENKDIAYQGIKRVGEFELTSELAREMIRMPVNTNGRKNSDVLRPWISGFDVVRRPQDMWIVDFGCGMVREQAAKYEAPYERIKKLVKPVRVGKREKRANECWWEYYWPRPEMRNKLKSVERYLAGPSVSKFRNFRFFDSKVIPDGSLVVIAREDYFAFGILHSKFHAEWGQRMGSTLEDRPAYTPSTSFETYPFPIRFAPNIPYEDYEHDPFVVAVTTAAAALNEARENWLNPPDQIVRMREVVSGYPDRIAPKNAEAAALLADRTLTKLYNESPTWLVDLHSALNEAVAEAYGWPKDIDIEVAMSSLLSLNRVRAAAS